MPEHTATEFRSKNKYGHRSKNKQRARSSSPPKRIGNIKSHKAYCTYCAPHLASRMEQRFIVQETFSEISKEVLHKSATIIDNE